MADIYNYLDYRKYLNDRYEELKDAEGVSHRILGKRGGFDPGLFSKVVTGQRDISMKMVGKFIDAFNMSEKEEDYFEVLVLFNQANTHSEKKYHLERLLSFSKCKVKKLVENQYEYYDKWYYSAVRELLHYYPFAGDFEDLADTLIPKIKVREAKKAIELLVGLDMVTQNEEGQYVLTDALITSGYETHSTAINNYVLSGISMAQDALDLFKPHERNLSSITFNYTEEELPELIEKFRSFRKDLMQMITRTPKANRVFQFNMQLFPLSMPYPKPVRPGPKKGGKK
ncbi:MAG: TIGR02147 family protein [Fibrobacterales bacterium]